MDWLPHQLSAVLATLIFAAHLAVAGRAITRPDRSPASRVAWVAVIMALPLVGIVGYLLLGETSIGRSRSRRLRQALAQMPVPPPPASSAPAPTAELRSLFALGRSVNGFPVVHGNQISLLGASNPDPRRPQADSNAAATALVAAIEQARETIHLSFYIWLDDHNGGLVADAVAAAAQRGVTCRVMVDALGSRAFTRSPRWRQLADAGVHAIATLNDIPRLGNLAVGRLDLRNHRKIAVIDNEISFCGSQNCADPEFRIAAKYAPWVDLWLRCEGPVVRQEQHLFLANWIAETGEQGLEHLPCAEPLPSSAAGGVLAQIFGTGPTTHNDSMSDMFVAAINTATRDLTITTPYFVPDGALLRAICAAPRRGVRTRLVLPARNNSRLVALSARSTYPAMLASGVELFEYPLGLLHSKSITADGELTLVGSANMDRRSLQLNFENNLVVSDPTLTQAVRQRQEGYLSVSRAVPTDEVASWPFVRRLAQNAVGMLSPLL